MKNAIITIEQPENFSFEACLQFLNRGYDECLYQVNKEKVTRVIRLSSGLAFITVSLKQQQIIIAIEKVSVCQNDKDEVREYVTDWFDINRDLSPFYQLLNSYKPTQSFAKDYQGLRLMGIVDLFEALCWCVIGQQINLTFAHKIKTRLVHKYGDKLTKNGGDYYCFPTAQVLLNIQRQELVDMQFSKQKINYIINISQAFCQGELEKKELLSLNKDEQMSKLTAIKGIGPWSANYVSMKSLRDMTCIAYGDTGLSSALHIHFATEKKPNKIIIDKIFQPFAGWESYLNFYLWRSLS